METLIVATDFSPAAENALAYAACLARHTGAKMVWPTVEAVGAEVAHPGKGKRLSRFQAIPVFPEPCITYF